jgi:multiple sugar transport system ATP-binding protein
MVFQNYALYPHMTVARQHGLRPGDAQHAQGRDRAPRRSRGRHAGHRALLERKPKALSGGQRQRVAMGRAMVRGRKVFLFDEPLSNLDAKLRVQMRTEIKALHQRLGRRCLRHARPGRGHDHGRPHRGAEGRRGAAVRHAAGTCRQVAGQPVRGRLHRLAGDELPPGLRVQVSVVEPLGSDTLVYFDRAGMRHVARVAPELQVRPRDTITLAFDMDKCHLFDAKDGAVLRA